MKKRVLQWICAVLVCAVLCTGLAFSALAEGPATGGVDTGKVTDEFVSLSPLGIVLVVVFSLIVVAAIALMMLFLIRLDKAETGTGESTDGNFGITDEMLLEDDKAVIDEVRRIQKKLSDEGFELDE